MWNEIDQKKEIQKMHHTICLEDFDYNKYIEYLTEIYDTFDLNRHIQILNDILRPYLFITITIIYIFFI